MFFCWFASLPPIAIGYFTVLWWVGGLGGLLLLGGAAYLFWPARCTKDFGKQEARDLKSGGAGGRQKRTFQRIRTRGPEFDSK